MIFTTQSGQSVGPIGQGTWYLGEDPSLFPEEYKALRTGVEAGMNLIDTAEMYGDGAAEELVGFSIQGMDRSKLFLVSKVYPFNAGQRHIFTSCEDSLRRMKTDYLDLYLLHWRGSIPLRETVECMEELKAKGRIREWGVSNLDTADMQELFAKPDGTHCAAEQVLYNVSSRGIEYDLLPLMQQHQIPVMAYCPLAQAGQLRRGLMRHPTLQALAGQHHATVPQIMLAFLLARPGVIPIPRSGRSVSKSSDTGGFIMEYRKFGSTYILRIDRGEEILASITTLCNAEKIRLGSVSGIGAVGEVTLGVFNREKFAYESTTYTGDYEIASCSGTITTKEGETYLHIHMAVGNAVKDECHGGHLNRAVVSLTGEFVIQQLDGTVEREYSPEVGLNLFKFSE